MKILLTGPPRSGKTTLLAKLLAGVAQKRGFVAHEVRENGERIGFDLEDETGRTAPLARTGKPTPYVVGRSRYFVDISSLELFIAPLFTFQPGHLLFIDEIAQMELCSSRFKELAKVYLDADNDFLGTISSNYEDEFIQAINARPDILTCMVAPDNRASLEPALACAIEHRGMVASLPQTTQQAIVTMGMAYLRDHHYTYFAKLFKNAVLYTAEGRIKRETGGFFVKGITNGHHVRAASGGTMTCDCDLFHGRGQFAGQKGLCSHIQTAKLLDLANG